MKHKILKISILGLLFCVLIFTCKKLDLIKVAYLSEPIVSDTSYTSAKVKAKIVDIGEGLSEHGFCWDTKAEPDMKSLNVTKKGPATAEQEYNSTLTNLSPNTTYFIRACAINTKGDTIYGKQGQFTTRKTKVPTLTTIEPTEIKADSAKTGGNITSDGGSPITEKGICWGLTPNPDLTNHLISPGTETGSFALTISGLNPDTTYYVKAYATNSTGTAFGAEYTFKTLIPMIVPVITTIEPSNITSNSATSGGNITNDGGVSVTAKGICWSTTPNPTLDLSTKTNDGNGSGSFASSITGLSGGTTYYIKAYATNSNGTYYGDEKTFTTKIDTVIIFNSNLSYGSITDLEGNVYKTVQIGTQTWMAENLKTTKYNDDTAIPNVTGNAAWAGLSTPSFCWYNNKIANKSTYGALYNWYAVDPKSNGNKNVCPSGWHVPSDAEWTTLTDLLGGEIVAGGKIKEIGTSHWIGPNTGTNNESGFTSLPGGLRFYINGTFGYIGSNSSFWSSTEYDAFSALPRSFSNLGAGTNHYQANKQFGYSVRCLKGENSNTTTPTISTNSISDLTSTSAISGGNVTSDGGSSVIAKGVCWSASPTPTVDINTKTNDGSGSGSYVSSITGLSARTKYYVRAYATNSNGTSYGNELSFTTNNTSIIFNQNLTYSSISDIDGNIYKTIKIGIQVWMAENLKTTHFNNGEAIPNITGNTAWVALTNGAYCWYDNDIANKATYGALYNWYTVTDLRNICPTSWHIPSDAEWKTLTDYLGGESAAGVKMKEIGTTHWLNPNTSATNESGFTALPGGYRYNDGGAFNNISLHGYWWNSTASDIADAWCRYLRYDYVDASRYFNDKRFGFSVRCVKDGSQTNVSTISTITIGNITSTSANSGGNVTSDGGASVTARGVCWSTSQNPIADLTTKTNDGSGTGSFVSSITGLSAGTTYYVKAYAINSSGIAYGLEFSFKTLSTNPVVSTVQPSDITANTATSGGNVTSDGGAPVIVRGVCWSTSQNPTAELTTKTNDGFGTGLFASPISGLSSGTKYYVRAYATNSNGTVYGNQLSFTTANSMVTIMKSFAVPGSSPNAIEWDGSSLWIVDNLNNFYQLDTIGNVQSTFAFHSEVFDLAWDGDGLWAYTSSQLEKIDSKGKILSTLPISYWDGSGIAWDGTYFWIGDYNLGKIYKHDSTGKLISFFETNFFGHPTGMAFNGTDLLIGDSFELYNKIYLYSKTGIEKSSVSLDELNLKKIKTFEHKALAWDGKYLWYSSDAQFEIYMLKVEW